MIGERKMNEEKQISDIAKIISQYEDCGDCKNCNFHNACLTELHATNIYKAGYRKQNWQIFLKAIWQLPQYIAGIVVKKIYKAKPYTIYKDANVYSWSIRGGLSLGKYIFVPFKNEEPASYVVQQYIKHEYGHTIQSKYLGWLYLLVIGLPSITWAGCFDKYRKKHGIKYEAFYTESWADKLGGVDR